MHPIKNAPYLVVEWEAQKIPILQLWHTEGKECGSQEGL
jgi:hypothetical protein